jgi:hypothetical protein
MLLWSSPSGTTEVIGMGEREAFVIFRWEDGGFASAMKIGCKCGHIEEGDLYFEDGEEWECPQCHRRIRFKWVGMSFKVLPPRKKRGV